MVTLATALPRRLATSRTRAALLVPAAPALVWLAARAIGVLVWWGMAPTGRPVKPGSWDGTFYASIAEFGYSGAHDHAQNGTMGSLDNTLAFFPGYPWLVKLAAPLTG